ncbi:MAG TPA: class F sortase [Mycobacteriales bacterium]|nr:class F sortase [Mycobacteriales bacterium]
MTHFHGTAPGAKALGAVPVGWRGPVAQALAVLVVLSVGLTTVQQSRADLAAERGQVPTLAVVPVARQVAPPVVLGIPKLGITTRLVGLRKANNGTLEVPIDPQRAGWYVGGAAPGDKGPAVIAGHVDSHLGPGVFAQLKHLRRGDEIRVRRADGTRVAFVVTQVQSYPKRRFPTRVVYQGDGRPALRLITCGGAFDTRNRVYRENTVVYAALKTVTLKKPTTKKPAVSKPAFTKEGT